MTNISKGSQEFMILQADNARMREQLTAFAKMLSEGELREAKLTQALCAVLMKHCHGAAKLSPDDMQVAWDECAFRVQAAVEGPDGGEPDPKAPETSVLLVQAYPLSEEEKAKRDAAQAEAEKKGATEHGPAPKIIIPE